MTHSEQRLSELEHCDCPMIGEGDHYEGTCGAEGPSGTLCSKPVGHEEAHASCAPNAHPVEVWKA